MAVAPNATLRRLIGPPLHRPDSLVPEHLRNAPTKRMKELGFGAEYRYAHDEPEAYAAGENYFPEGMPKVEWYKPTPRGLEQKIAEKLAHLRELDRQAKKK
jgi:putative ATPase